jgi:hypothetical protein
MTIPFFEMPYKGKMALGKIPSNYTMAIIASLHIMEQVGYKSLCLVQYLWAIWVSQNFQMNSETCTMACTNRTP